AEKDEVEAFGGGDAGGAQGVRDGLEVLRARRRQHDQPDAPIARPVQALGDAADATENRDVVSARRQPNRELLGEGLETAVSRRDPAGAEDGEAERGRHREARSTTGRAFATAPGGDASAIRMLRGSSIAEPAAARLRSSSMAMAIATASATHLARAVV